MSLESSDFGLGLGKKKVADLGTSNRSSEVFRPKSRDLEAQQPTRQVKENNDEHPLSGDRLLEQSDKIDSRQG